MAFNYFTAEGLELIRAEYREIMNVVRPDTVEKLAWAASLGDRSENADYQYNKQYLRQIDRKIHYLSNILNEAQVANRSAEGKEKNIVLFGAYVQLENDDGDIKNIRIVNRAEIYNRKGLISFESPMAKALLKLTIDDEAIVNTPKGKVSWYVNKISYELPEWFGELEEPYFEFSPNRKEKEIKEFSEEEQEEIRKQYLETLLK